LAPDELAQLEANILRDGCRDPLVVWDGILIDGHNRHEICVRHELPFETTEMAFEDRTHAIEWIIRNQFGRRNLPAYERAKLALRMKLLIAARAKENQIRKPADFVLQKSAEQKPIDTRAELAAMAGVSHDTIAKVEKIEAKAAPLIRMRLASQEISINQAYKEIIADEKKKKRNEEIAKQKEAIESGAVKLPEGVFEVVAMDPPWNYGREYDPETSRVANPYPEMTQEQILALNPPFAEDCVLFLWTTQAFIWDAKELLDAWGFTYKATIVWDKEKIGMGMWLRMQCEFCLVGIKGNPPWNNTRWRDIIRESRR
jgi:hypothetical protein